MRIHLIAAAVALLGAATIAHADLTIIDTGNGTDTFKTETGQSMPTGVGCFVNGSFLIQNAEALTWTYGAGLLAGDTGHGNATQPDSLTIVDANNVSHVFCTQVDATIGCAAATAVGTSFTAPFTAGPVDYFFTVDQNGTVRTLQHDATSSFLSALLQIGTGTTANAGPGPVGYIGLSDLPSPDVDYQDLVARVSQVPEPATLPVLGVALAGIAVYARRRINLVK